MEPSELKTYPDIPKSFGIFGIIVGIMILVAPVNFLLNKLVGEEFSFFAYYLLAMGIPFLIIHNKRKIITRQKGYNFNLSSLKISVLIIVTVIALQVGIISPVNELIPMSEFIKEVFLDLAGKTGIFSFLAIVVAAPLLEELIFRGVILDGLLKKYTPEKSILVSSFLFGIVHLNPWQFIAAFVLGIFAGWVYYKTRNLFLPVLLHAVNNLIAFLAIYFTDYESMMDIPLVDFYGGIIPFLIIIIGSVVVGGACVYWLLKEFQKKENEKGMAHSGSVPLT